ncbi:hypothetical protein ANN_04414 [Periplaneta americana]|uniref:Uncharacterized protein n=1 Tax=Periplaneta americana TaxID=6978 RepID=A0ABQ8T9P5_PERAM|nr:hypothetical protein ANN_04414 [Periplaneta americana]
MAGLCEGGNEPPGSLKANGSSEAKTPDDEDDGVYEDVGLPEESSTVPDIEVRGNCVTVIRVGDPEEPKPRVDEFQQHREEEEEDKEEYEKADEYQLTLHLAAPIATTRRNPSPYYYGDLFRDDNEPPQSEAPRRTYSTRQPRYYRKSASLDTPAAGAPCDGTASVSSLILSEVSGQHAASSAGSLLAACLLEWDALLMPPHRQLRGQQDLPSVCACAGGGQCLDEDDDEADDVDFDPRNRHLHYHHHHHHHYRQHRDGGRAPVEEPPVDYDVPEEGEDEYGYDMSGRQRHLYETAFDCKVSRSDDDLDDVDRVTNHPVLQMFGSNKISSSTNTGNSLARSVRATSSQDPTISVGIFTPKERRKVTLVRGKLVKERPKAIPSRLLQSDTASSTTTLSQDLDGLELDDREDDKPEPSPPLPLRGYSPSPPSTAPLPAKFHGNNKDILAMNSIRSAPNLPSTSPAHPRLKDMRLPVKSLRARELPDSRKGSIMEFKGRPRSMVHQEESVPEFKGRPRKQEEQPILEFKGRPGKIEEPVLDFGGKQRGLISQDSGPILEFKGRPTSSNRRCGVRPKYSSTESMATSSSGGSLESIRSSTSEGNRSTTSSESHRSSSLSSHSSDSASSSGGGGSGSGGPSSNPHHLHHYYHHHHHHHHQCSGAGTPLTVGSGGRFFAHQSNKLHILSPISDKSSQEPVSETSDNNRNNNSQKASPEDTDQITSPASTTKVSTDSQPWGDTTAIKLKRRTPQNKNLINLTLQQQQQSSSSGEAEIQGSDSGISIESRGGTKGNKVYNLSAFSFAKQTDNSNVMSVGPVDNEQPTADFSDLPFDMPKLRRRRLLQQDNCTSGSATSVDLHDLPFDMPKLRRRLRGQPPLQQQQPQTSTESSGVSQASSSQSVRDAERPASVETISLMGKYQNSANLSENRDQQSLCHDLVFTQVLMKLGDAKSTW